MTQKTAQDSANNLTVGPGHQEAPGSNTGGPGTTQPRKKGYVRKPGVDPKVREAKQRANAASHAAKAARGKTAQEARRQEIAELDKLVQELRQHAVDQNLGWDFDERQEFFHWGQRILKAGIYHKKPNEDLDVSSPLMEEDNALPFEQQQYVGFYVPEAAARMAGLSHQVHLTQPLVDFMVRVFNVAKKEFFLVPGATNKEVRYVLQELQQREAGVDTYEPWSESPKQKVGGVDMSTWPKDFQKRVLSSNREPLNFDDTRLFLTLALAQDLPEDLRKRWEAALNPAPKKEIPSATIDPMVLLDMQAREAKEERQRQQEEEHLRQMSPDAWAFLKGIK